MARQFAESYRKIKLQSSQPTHSRGIPRRDGGNQEACRIVAATIVSMDDERLSGSASARSSA
jgi:hypothetical protein